MKLTCKIDSKKYCMACNDYDYCDKIYSENNVEVAYELDQ